MHTLTSEDKREKGKGRRLKRGSRHARKTADNSKIGSIDGNR
ncbi:MAG: hypothetical protein WA220_10805 [Candidatus Nitrosopolaris sp.]